MDLDVPGGCQEEGGCMKPLTFGVIGLGGAGRAHATRFDRDARVGRVVAFDTNNATVK